jgi:hypothetical protein
MSMNIKQRLQADVDYHGLSTDAELSRDALAEIERLEFELSECERAAKLYKSAMRSGG